MDQHDKELALEVQFMRNHYFIPKSRRSELRVAMKFMDRNIWCSMMVAQAEPICDAYTNRLDPKDYSVKDIMVSEMVLSLKFMVSDMRAGGTGMLGTGMAVGHEGTVWCFGDTPDMDDLVAFSPQGPYDTWTVDEYCHDSNMLADNMIIALGITSSALQDKEQMEKLLEDLTVLDDVGSGDTPPPAA